MNLFNYTLNYRIQALFYQKSSIYSAFVIILHVEMLQRGVC